jgi:MarR family transcriptional regulator for hemolysin
VARAWHRLADGALAEFGISNSSAWCLIYLDRLGENVRQIDLAEHLQISQPSLVRTLNHVQAAGLVLREAAPDDRRSNLLNLTPAGRHLVGRIEAALDALRRDLLDGVPIADIETAVRLHSLLGQRIAERRVGKS